MYSQEKKGCENKWQEEGTEDFRCKPSQQQQVGIFLSHALTSLQFSTKFHSSRKLYRILDEVVLPRGPQHERLQLQRSSLHSTVPAPTDEEKPTINLSWNPSVHSVLLRVNTTGSFMTVVCWQRRSVNGTLVP